MSGKQNLIVIVLLLLVLMIIGWGTQGAQHAASEDPSGTYIAFTSLSPGERTVILELSGDAVRSAMMTIDAENRETPRISRGTWAISDTDTLSVVFPDATYAFAVGTDVLRLRNAPVDVWGPQGLALTQAFLPLDSQWRWTKTVYADGTNIEPTTTSATSSSFVMKLGSDLRLSVTGDCNTIAGDFHIRQGGIMSVRNILATKARCEGSRENQFIIDLGSVTSYAIRGDTLMFSLADDRGTMMFERFAGDIPPR